MRLSKKKPKQFHDFWHTMVGSSTKTHWELESLGGSERHFEARTVEFNDHPKGTTDRKVILWLIFITEERRLVENGKRKL